MFQIAYKNWLDTGGVYGRWRAVPVPSAQIATANQEMETSLRNALGPERYLDYQMATSETGQQLRALAARFDLPRETLAQAFQMQIEADQLAKGRNPLQQPSSERLAELQNQLPQILGPSAWVAWQDARNQKVSLDP